MRFLQITLVSCLLINVSLHASQSGSSCSALFTVCRLLNAYSQQLSTRIKRYFEPQELHIALFDLENLLRGKAYNITVPYNESALSTLREELQRLISRKHITIWDDDGELIPIASSARLMSLGKSGYLALYYQVEEGPPSGQLKLHVE